MIPLFWRHIRTTSRISLPTSLVLSVAVLIFAPPFGVWAQAPSGQSVVVTGSSRGVDAKVLVTATSEGAIRSHEEIGANGVYNFSLLPTGDFLAKSSAPAFMTPGMELANLKVAGMAGFDQVGSREPAPAVPPASETSLTWRGITFYGAYDVGFGWVSHGLPQNPYNYEGSSLVNRNANGSRFLIEPNNLSQTSLGVRGREPLGHDWYAVFNASTGINPQSGQLANASLTMIQNNGQPRAAYSEAIDGARAGQPFNDEFYGGVSSAKFGALTFGRQRALGTDAMILYDPVAGGYAFSYIAYNGTMAGGGDTENSRWDHAVKYRLTFGQAHFGAMYKIVDGNGGCFSASATWTDTTCTPEQPHNNAYGFNLGGIYQKLFGDITYQHYNQAISVLNPLLGPTSPTQPYQSTTNSINTNPITGTNLISTTNTVNGIVTDNNAIMGAAKYMWDPLKFFAGYEYIWQNNPSNPLGVGASDQGGFLMSSVEDNNLDREKLVQIWWTGVKYTYRTKTDVTLSWYEQRQSNFRTPPTCGPGNMRSSCAGTLDEGSLYTDHRFTTRFDGFAGLAYSFVTGGLAIAIPHGPGVPYLHNSNFAPTIGGRFVF